MNYAYMNYENMNYAYDNMNQIIVAVLVYTVGITFGGFIVSKFAWGESFEEFIEVVEVYEEKYPLNPDISGNIPTNTTIIEATPDGSVIMSYDYDNEGFRYWSDTTIKYKYLETAARKFVKMNCCSDIYIDRADNIKKQNDALDREEAEQVELAELAALAGLVEEESVFVKRKIKKKKINRNNLAATKANKYIKVGKFSDFKWLQKVEPKTIKKICYDDFKHM
jgi:hypothetical protein